MVERTVSCVKLLFSMFEQVLYKFILPAFLKYVTFISLTSIFDVYRVFPITVKTEIWVNIIRHMFTIFLFLFYINLIVISIRFLRSTIIS